MLIELEPFTRVGFFLTPLTDTIRIEGKHPVTFVYLRFPCHREVTWSSTAVFPADLLPSDGTPGQTWFIPWPIVAVSVIFINLWSQSRLLGLYWLHHSLCKLYHSNSLRCFQYHLKGAFTPIPFSPISPNSRLFVRKVGPVGEVCTQNRTLLGINENLLIPTPLSIFLLILTELGNKLFSSKYAPCWIQFKPS